MKTMEREHRKRKVRGEGLALELCKNERGREAVFFFFFFFVDKT